MKSVFQILAVIVIISGGLLVNNMLTSSRKPPAKKHVEVLAPLLTVEKVAAGEFQMKVAGFGTVRPKISVNVIPQVGGVVMGTHDDFVDGGFFNAEESLIIIDSRDYKTAVQSAQAEVAQAKVQVEKEKAEAEVARKEWYNLNPNEQPTSPLVLRVSQIAQARAQLTAAQARLGTAELNLERTEIKMPFNGRISERSVDVGQYVTPGQMVAKVYGTDAVEIVVPLEDSELPWFDIPMAPGQTDGSNVVVVADFGGRKHEWAGKVVRTQGQIDAKSRMVNVVVEVEKPFELSNGRPPLVPGMFVEVNILGKKSERLIRVPRTALRSDGDAVQLWTVNDGTLHICDVEVIRSDRQYAYISSGIADGQTIVTGQLDTVVEGIKIRIEETCIEESVEADK